MDKNEIVEESTALLIGGISSAIILGMAIVHDMIERKKRIEAEKLINEEKNRRINSFLAKNSPEKLLRQMKNDVRKAVQNINTDKEEMGKLAKESKGKRFRIVYKDEGDYIEIIEGDQLTKINLRRIVEGIVKALEIKYAEPIKLGIVRVSGGDGDEGCVYIELNEKVLTMKPGKDSGKNPIKEAFENLKSNYTPVTVIEFMKNVKSQPLEKIIENSTYILSEPTIGHKFINNIIKTCEIDTNDLIILKENMNSYYNKAVNGGYKNKEHLESIKESLECIDEILRDSDNAKFIAEETIYNLHKESLPRHTLMEENMTNVLDNIIFNIGDTPSLAVTYAVNLGNIKSLDDFLRSDPGAVIIKNTSIILNMPQGMYNSDRDYVEKIINLPMTVAEIIERDSSNNILMAENIKAIIHKQLQRIDIALNQNIGDTEIVSKYKESLEKTHEKLCYIIESELETIKECLMLAFSEGTVEDPFDFDDSELELDLDDFSNSETNEELEEEKEYLEEEPEPSVVDESFQPRELFDVKLLEQMFAVEFIKTFIDDSEEINLESFNRMIEIANIYDIALEANELKQSPLEHAFKSMKYYNGKDWLILLLLGNSFSLVNTIGTYKKDIDGKSYYDMVDKAYSDFKKECKQANTRSEIKKKIAECESLINKLENNKDKIAQKGFGAKKVGSFNHKTRIRMIEVVIIKLKNLKIDLKDKLESVKESFDPEIDFIEGENINDITLEANSIINGARKVALSADNAVRKMEHRHRRRKLGIKRVTAIAKRVPQRIDRMVDTTINTLVKLDRNERRKRIIEGGYKTRLFKLIRKAVLTGAVAFVHPALAAITLIASVARDKKLDARVRARIVEEMEAELTIINEKIDDAKAANDRQKKYQLMRLKNKLERDIVRIRYNIRDMEE